MSDLDDYHHPIIYVQTLEATDGKVYVSEFVPYCTAPINQWSYQKREGLVRGNDLARVIKCSRAGNESGQKMNK